jgi:cobalt/nickel transport protein
MTTGLFVGAGLLVALALAAIVAPHASKAPDGLEKVAEKGFAAKAEVWKHAPMPDYEVPSAGRGSPLATGLAAVIGTLVVFAAAVGIGMVIRRRPRSSRRGGTSAGKSDERRTTGREGGDIRSPAAGEYERREG